MTPAGRVLSLHIAAAAGTAMNEVAEVLAVAGRGLAGDRYCTSSGTYSHYPGSGREVTLIEVEALDALARDYDVHACIWKTSPLRALRGD
jgi:hypothetical protein